MCVYMCVWLSHGWQKVVKKENAFSGFQQVVYFLRQRALFRKSTPPILFDGFLFSAHLRTPLHLSCACVVCRHPHCQSVRSHVARHELLSRTDIQQESQLTAKSKTRRLFSDQGQSKFSRQLCSFCKVSTRHTPFSKPTVNPCMITMQMWKPNVSCIDLPDGRKIQA